MSAAATPLLPPPLREGDRLTREQFLLRWEAMPHLKHAELIDGVVYMPSPVSTAHGDHHYYLNGWLFTYTSRRRAAGATWRAPA